MTPMQSQVSLPEQDIVQRSRSCFSSPCFAYPPVEPVAWVKFGGRERLAEANMQKVAWEWVRKERDAHRCSSFIGIPEIYKTFERDDGVYIIMQLLDAQVFAKCRQFTKDQRCDLIAEGIEVLRRMPVPEDATPGPYVGETALRMIRHPMFKDHEAPIVYPDVDELEAHTNRTVATLYRRKGPPYPTVNLERELVFCYCDFNDENFMFNTNADGRPRLYIIDFEYASFLPVGFLSYALFKEGQRWTTSKPLIVRIGQTLPQSNLELMGQAAYVFMVSSTFVGLTQAQKAVLNPAVYAGGRNGIIPKGLEKQNGERDAKVEE